MKAQDLTGRRVLILEDEFLVALQLEHVVRAAGGVVVGPFTATGQALTRIEAGEADVALLNTDIGQRRATGVAEALRARGIPFALIVPYRGAVYAEPALRGAPRLTAPCSLGELVQAVAQAMHAAAQPPVSASRGRGWMVRLWRITRLSACGAGTACGLRSPARDGFRSSAQVAISDRW